jgi:hypothetical protein
LAAESGDFKEGVQVTPQGNGVELIIRIPLQFQMVTLVEVSAKRGVANRE